VKNLRKYAFFLVACGLSIPNPMLTAHAAGQAAASQQPEPVVGEAATVPAADSQAAAEPTGEVAEAAPEAIGRLNAALIDIMQRADGLGYGGRFEVVAPVVSDLFDIPFMAAKSIGGYWRKLNGEERRRWVKTFEVYMVSNFADRFDGFSGESFEIVGEKPASRETLMVQTRLNRPGEDAVDLDYRMREEERGWKVVDIYSDGKISEVALRRSEYSAVLKRGGIEQLIAAVDAKTKKRAGK